MASEVVREMPGNDGSDGPGKFRPFTVSAGITLTIGVGLAVMAILYFRPAKEIVEVEVEKIIRMPAPPPRVVVKEVIKEVVKEVPSPAPKPLPPPVTQARTPQPWVGIWRPRTSELPMFKLQEAGGTVAGIYASAAGAVLPFKGGKVDGDAIVLVVDDSLFRVHFRLAMKDSQSLSVESWITDEDWLISLARANKKVRTRQQALAVQRQLAENAKLTRKRASLGTLYRGTDN